MKYVVTKSMGIEVPTIFSEFVDHNTVAEKAISAGFCRFFVNAEGKLDVNCWGKSVTLGCKSRGDEDAALILHTNAFEV